jgi:hypothetical protein
MIRPLQS